MKKLLSLLLVCVFVFGAFAGAVMPVKAQSENKLTVWCWDPAFNIYAMKEAEKVYQQINPDFVLEVIETPWGDVQTKVTTAAMSGKLDTLPDIFLMQDNSMQKNVMNYPDVFAELTDSGIKFDDFSSAKVAYSVVDGKNYAVPFDSGAVVYAFRTDILGEAGYTKEDLTDLTWNEFIEKGKDIVAKTGKPMLSTLAGEPDLIMEMLQSAGASLFNEDGSLNVVGNDALEEAVRVYKELVDTGILIETNDWDQYIGTFINGTVSGTINGSWILASVQTAQDQAGNWAVTNIPSLNEIEGATNYSNNGGSSWVVTTNAKNYDLAVDFLANTFAGSVPFYETILPSSGAIATYLPAGESEVYAEPQEFFGGQAIYADIMDFSAQIPSNYTGAYYYEARDNIGTALTRIIKDNVAIDKALQEASDQITFLMGF